MTTIYHSERAVHEEVSRGPCCSPRGRPYDARMARLDCSFCGKAEDAVGHLVTGPRRVAICNECVDVCTQVNAHTEGFDGDVLLTGIGTLVTNDRFVEGPLGPIPDAAVAIVGGIVRWAGPERAMPDRHRDLPTLDCGGRVAIPGLIDAHGPGPAPGPDPAARWHGALAAGTTTIAAVCAPDQVATALAAGADALPEIGVLADGWVGPLPEGPVRSLGMPGREADWVRILPGDDPVAAVASSERSDPRGYVVERLDERTSSALAATRRSVIVVPAGPGGGGDAGPFWEGGVVALGSGGTPRYGGNASMALAVWLAVRDLGLTLEQALWSATRGSAVALDWGERGHLVRGAVGDVAVVGTDRLADLAQLDWHPWRILRAGVEV